MLTASAQTKDSIKFSIAESKVLITTWNDAPLLLEYIDSCESQIQSQFQIIKNERLKNKSCEDIKGLQEELISEQRQQSDLLQSELKKANKRYRFMAGVGGVELLFILIQSIRK